ncbi:MULTISPECIES: lipase family protein [unclassified Paenibacillus]|uniref:lipase family protein n=1 Tax=unclassified Paenibacillus TaxID=185978 RepID=UPI002F3FC407
MQPTDEIRGSSNPAGPDWQNAIFLAALCGQTYMQYENKTDGLFLVPKSYTLVGSFTARSYDNRYEPFGFVITSDQATIIAFRGTSSAVDWVSDFIAQQTLYRPVKNAGQTHKGFTDIYMSARDQVIELLLQTPPDRPLFITGHSLGGALATLAALDIAKNTYFFEPFVYTFGAPRVGDPEFVKFYNYTIASHWRFQNEFDIVPHLPPLVYQSPKTKKNYFYLHVKGEVMRSFRMGSVSGNHILSSYFNDLAKDNEELTQAICSEPPGWCPLDLPGDEL